MYAIQTGAVIPNKKKAIARGREMVAAGKARREVAVEIYDECYINNNVQDVARKRRIRHIVELLSDTKS